MNNHSTFLNKPIRITDQQWSKETIPLVSISCITYNHENYIRDAIDGFLMQKTTFPVEILIHDDASTDKTASIVREYELKYPQLIKPIYQTENQYSKKDGTIGRIQRGRARGKYYATCEGDDYWTDPLKLQKQVEFLEVNKDCSLCFHASKKVRNNNPQEYSLLKPKYIPKDGKFEMKDAILGGGGFMTTNSMLFHRAYMLERPDWMEKAPVGDVSLMLLLASKGRMGYINEVMSVYRVNLPGSWTESMKSRNAKKKVIIQAKKMFLSFNEWTNGKYSLYIYIKIFRNYLSIVFPKVLLKLWRSLNE